MQDHSLFPRNKIEKKEEQELEQLRQYFYEIARDEVNKFFDAKFEKTKKAFQEGISEAEKIAQEKYEQLLLELFILSNTLLLLFIALVK